MAADEKFEVIGDFSSFNREAEKANKVFDKLTANVKKFATEAKAEIASVKAELNFKIPSVPRGGSGVAGGGGVGASSLSTASLQRAMATLGSDFTLLGNTTRSLTREINRAIRDFNRIRGTSGSGGSSGGSGGGAIPPGGSTKPSSNGNKKTNAGFTMTGHWGSDLAFSMMPMRGMFPGMAIRNGMVGAGFSGAAATAGGIAGGLGVAGSMAALTAMIAGSIQKTLDGVKLRNIVENSYVGPNQRFSLSEQDLKSGSKRIGLDASEFGTRIAQFQSATGLGSDKASEFVNWAADMSAASNGRVSVDQAQQALEQALNDNTTALAEVSKSLGVDADGKTLSQVFSEQQKAGIIGNAQDVTKGGMTNAEDMWNRAKDSVTGDWKEFDKKVLGEYNQGFKNGDNIAQIADRVMPNDLTSALSGRENGKTVSFAREQLLKMVQQGLIDKDQFHNMLNNIGDIDRSTSWANKKVAPSESVQQTNPVEKKDPVVQAKNTANPLLPAGQVRNLNIRIPNLPKALGSVSLTEDM